MDNLAQVEMFISFLELVKNPDKYTKMLEEMQDRTNEYKEVVQAYTDVKSANKYFDRLKQEHVLRVEKYGKAEVEFEQKKQVFIDEVKAKLESDENQKMILVQNINLWEGWRLSSIDVDKAVPLNNAENAIEQTRCLLFYSELEGYTKLSNGKEVFLTGDWGHHLFSTE